MKKFMLAAAVLGCLAVPAKAQWGYDPGVQARYNRAHANILRRQMVPGYGFFGPQPVYRPYIVTNPYGGNILMYSTGVAPLYNANYRDIRPFIPRH